VSTTKDAIRGPSTSAVLRLSTGSSTWRRSFAAALAAFALTLTACGEVETGTEDSYHPATVTSPDPANPTALPVVKLTDEAASRIDLTIATIRLEDDDVVVDYEALIWDSKGKPWVYAVQGPLTFVRASVTIDEIDDDEATLLAGPPVGTQVVAQGVTQVYGAELGMEGGH
jgi:hypothetical protein